MHESILKVLWDGRLKPPKADIRTLNEGERIKKTPAACPPAPLQNRNKKNINRTSKLNEWYPSHQHPELYPQENFFFRKLSPAQKKKNLRLHLTSGNFMQTTLDNFHSKFQHRNPTLPVQSAIGSVEFPNVWLLNPWSQLSSQYLPLFFPHHAYTLNAWLGAQKWNACNYSFGWEILRLNRCIPMSRSATSKPLWRCSFLTGGGNFKRSARKEISLLQGCWLKRHLVTVCLW